MNISSLLTFSGDVQIVGLQNKTSLVMF